MCGYCAGVLTFHAHGLTRSTPQEVAEQDNETLAALVDFRCELARQARADGVTLLGFDGPLVAALDPKRRAKLD